MISMDSSNLHLASLLGGPVVSVWGATHPFVGFSGNKQPAEYTVQLEMPCRPCSVYGKGTLLAKGLCLLGSNRAHNDCRAGNESIENQAGS